MNKKRLKQEVLPFVKKLALEVGDLLADKFHTMKADDFSLKGKGDIVTQADKLAESMIISKIKAEFPEHNILSEESGAEGKESKYTWVIDPLDGTTNFAMKSHFWNVSVALIKEVKPILGVVYAPMFKEMYWAIAGEGAFLNDQRIQLADAKKDEPTKTFHGYCYGDGLPDAKTVAAEYYKHFLHKGYPIRQLGAAALELARVGSGLLASMVVPGANPWDVAAGALIVQEAGGVVTDLAGNKYTMDNKTGIIAANSQSMHQQVAQSIKRLALSQKNK